MLRDLFNLFGVPQNVLPPCTRPDLADVGADKWPLRTCPLCTQGCWCSELDSTPCLPWKETGRGFSEEMADPVPSLAPTSSLPLWAVNCKMGRPREGGDTLLFSVSSEEEQSRMWPSPPRPPRFSLRSSQVVEESTPHSPPLRCARSGDITGQSGGVEARQKVGGSDPSVHGTFLPSSPSCFPSSYRALGLWCAPSVTSRRGGCRERAFAKFFSSCPRGAQDPSLGGEMSNALALFYFFLQSCGKTCRTKFTTVASSQGPVSWHYLRSRCGAGITFIHPPELLPLPQLPLCTH